MFTYVRSEYAIRFVIFYIFIDCHLIHYMAYQVFFHVNDDNILCNYVIYYYSQIMFIYHILYVYIVYDNVDEF